VLALWLLISLPLGACSLGTPSAPSASSARTKVVVATSASYPPFEFMTDNRQSIIGFDIDLMKAIAAKSGLDVEFTNLPYEAVLAGVADCTYTAGIAAIAVDDNLKSQMSFSDPYFTVGQVVVVKQGNPTITSRETLVGQTVGVQAGSAGASELKKISGARPKVYPAADQAFDELINGLIDAVVADNAQALGYIGVRANGLKIVGDAFAGSNYGIAVCGQHPELLQKINAGLAAVRADGTLDKLTQEWIVGGGR
jgi:polar amino acid transport system substrate-binding protein